jgi:hypothetical protein
MTTNTDVIPTDNNSVLTFIEVRGRRYPTKHVRNCKTCRSIHRQEIEAALINGDTYASVVRNVAEQFDFHSPLGTPTYNSILAHTRRGHMPLPYLAQRRAIEARAKELRKSVEDGEHNLLDGQLIAHAVLQRGYEMLNTGALNPSMKDLLEAARLERDIAALQSDTDQMGEDAWREALTAYMDIVRQHVPAQVFQQINQAMALSPALAKISQRRAVPAVQGKVEEK